MREKGGVLDNNCSLVRGWNSRVASGASHSKDDTSGSFLHLWVVQLQQVGCVLSDDGCCEKRVKM